MPLVHHILGIVAIVLTLAAALAATWSWRAARRSEDRRDHRFAVDRLILGVVAVLVVDALTGLLSMAAPTGPDDSLHLLYAPLALATLPVGWWLGGPVRRRRDARLVLASCILLAIEWRLVVTG